MSRKSAIINAVLEEIRRSASTIEGTALTKPFLFNGAGAGGALMYVVDVQIGSQTEIIRNVPIAPNITVQYAEPGYAVTLSRNVQTGNLEVIGLATKRPGSIFRIAVDLSSMVSGTPSSAGLSSRYLTYGELATYGTYGIIPYGAIAIFRGSTLVEIRW